MVSAQEFCCGEGRATNCGAGCALDEFPGSLRRWKLEQRFVPLDRQREGPHST